MSKVSWLTMGGTGMAIHSSAGVVLTDYSQCPPVATADLRRRAGMGRERPLYAIPVYAGERRMPRTEATFQRTPPLGVGMLPVTQRLGHPIQA